MGVIAARHGRQDGIRAMAAWWRWRAISTTTASELMFQGIADRAKRTAVIVTTNLPFSEWPQIIPNPWLCKALIDRLTDRAQITTNRCGLLPVPPAPPLSASPQVVNRSAKRPH